MSKNYDYNWDLKLNVNTNIFDYMEEDYQNYGYDPTPYIVLEEMVKQNIIKEDDTLVDYGCGKGRVEFFLNKSTGCKTIGVDHSKRLLQMAENNLEKYGKTDNIKFVHSKAEEYLPDDNVNYFYLYNPFSTKIFRQVLRRITESYNKNPREILIFFYYSTIEYKMYLPTEQRLKMIKNITFDKETINDRVPAYLSIYQLNAEE